jgi:hypothetical protein
MNDCWPQCTPQPVNAKGVSTHQVARARTTW